MSGVNPEDYGAFAKYLTKPGKYWMDKLDQTEHDQILGGIIKEMLDGKEPSTGRATAVILGGQSGAGKGGMTANAMTAMGGNGVVIDPDEMRIHHPRYVDYLKIDPDNAPGLVHPDAKLWANEVTQYCIENNYNIISDTTLGNKDWAVDLITRLSAQNYEIEVHAIAVKKEISQEGVRSRYERAWKKKNDLLEKEADYRKSIDRCIKKLETTLHATEEKAVRADLESLQRRADAARKEADETFPRNVNERAQNSSYSGLQDTIDELFTNHMGSIGRMVVFERGNGILADTNSGGNPVEALRSKRDGKMKPAELSAMRESMAETLKWREERIAKLREKANGLESEEAAVILLQIAELEEDNKKIATARTDLFKSWLSDLNEVKP